MLYEKMNSSVQSCVIAHFVFLTEWNNFKKDTIAQKQIFIYENDTFKATTGGPGSDVNVFGTKNFQRLQSSFHENVRPGPFCLSY